jgi:hypothetical protein
MLLLPPVLLLLLLLLLPLAGFVPQLQYSSSRLFRSRTMHSRCSPPSSWATWSCSTVLSWRH